MLPRLRPHEAHGPAAYALRAALAARGAEDPVAAFYAARGDRPLWTEHGRLRPEAGRLIAALRAAGRDGLTPAKYGPDRLQGAVAAAASGAPAALARAEVLLSAALAAYAVDLHRPPEGARMAFVDPAAPKSFADPRGALETVAHAPSLSEGLAAVQQVNPIYAALRDALAAAPGDPRRRALIRINLERARALPADPGRRYILVNPAAPTLWLYENGAVADEMKVVVGKPSEPTPAMIGLIRYADLEPYWNVPPDLARGVARKVLASGPGVLAAQHMQALSDWTDNAVPVPPEAVDWQAVADGRELLRLRQLPGPDNMMGKLKLMLPNPLGVYLHDTPLKGLFAGTRRTASAGCVRLWDAEELARRLFGRDLAPDPARGPEQRVDLAAPVPVYIVYLTVQPTDRGLAWLPDIYGRDDALLHSLAAQSAAAM